jgi:hypothetical protein
MPVVLPSKTDTHFSVTPVSLTVLAASTGQNVTTLASDGKNLFAGSYNGGIFVLAQSKTSWSAASSGMTTSAINALIVSGSYLFAGTDNGVWRRPIAEMVTEVDNRAKKSPDAFLLFQCYPNPFNSSTVISYQLTVNCFVTLKVYDILGKEVATLEDGQKQSGFYQATFDGARFASGIYFYRLETGNFVQTKKLILLK